MNCVNRNLPEFKMLQGLSGTNEFILAAKISVWQDQNGLESFPTIEDLGLARQPMFKKTSFFQLDVDKVSDSIKELDTHLLKFLKAFNVKSKEFDDLKVKLNVNALGATDILNKLIWYSKNRNEHTLPEEAAHMLVALAGDRHPEIKELLATIDVWEGYQDVYKQYYNIYNGDIKKIKIEAVGKIIASSLVKQYKDKGLEKNKLEKAISKLLDYIEKVLESVKTLGLGSTLELMTINEKLADKIALNVLAGNTNYIYEINNLNEDLNANFEINQNPLAKEIIKTFADKQSKVTGSLAIAATGENIRRPKGSGIHDIDFKVNSFSHYQDNILPKIEKLKGIPYHYGWHKEEYSTYAFLVPKENYTIKVLERKDDFSNGLILNYEVYDKQGNQVKPDQSNVMAVDFFVYKEEHTQKDFEYDGSFSPASYVYEGKMSLGYDNYFFNRDKDQEDFVLRDPKHFLTNDKFVFYQLNKQPINEVDKVDSFISEDKSFLSGNVDTENDFISGKDLSLDNKLDWRTEDNDSEDPFMC